MKTKEKRKFTLFSKIRLVVISGLFIVFSTPSYSGLLENDKESETETSSLIKRLTPETKQNENFPKKQKTDPVISPEENPTLPSQSQLDASSSAPEILQENSPQTMTLFDKFKQIKQSPSSPIFPPYVQNIKITAQLEDQEGSRKWVKFFNFSEGEAHAWHKKMPEIIKAFKQENSKLRCLDLSKNVAVARLVFVRQNGDIEPRDLPYFFVSGWPGGTIENPAKRFATLLANEKLGYKLRKYKNYGLRFIAKSYKGQTEENLRDPDNSEYSVFKNEINEILRKELQAEGRILGENRLRFHSQVMGGVDINILRMRYFHSEQAIWMTAKTEIATFKKNSNGTLDTFLGKTNPLALARVFIDICSYKDMCWCCGDTFVSCCHTDTLEAKTYVRASGCVPHADLGATPDSHKLQEHREEFPGYIEGRAFQIFTNDDPNSYRPYIAHSVASDLP